MDLVKSLRKLEKLWGKMASEDDDKHAEPRTRNSQFCFPSLKTWIPHANEILDPRRVTGDTPGVLYERVKGKGAYFRQRRNLRTTVETLKWYGFPYLGCWLIKEQTLPRIIYPTVYDSMLCVTTKFRLSLLTLSLNFAIPAAICSLKRFPSFSSKKIQHEVLIMDQKIKARPDVSALQAREKCIVCQ